MLGTRQLSAFSEQENGVDNLEHLRLRGIEEVRILNALIILK